MFCVVPCSLTLSVVVLTNHMNWIVSSRTGAFCWAWESLNISKPFPEPLDFVLT